MKILLCTLAILLSSVTCKAQTAIGRWKKISHIGEYNGQKFDSHIALLTQRPCAAKMIWEVNANGDFRLDASGSGCDENYKKIQEKLYSKTKWKIDENKITISATNFAVGQIYTLTLSGNTMTWTGTEGQGIITYQRL